MYRFLKLAWRAVLVLLVLAPVLLPFALLQDHRLVAPAGTNVFDDVEKAKVILSKFNPRRMDPNVDTIVSVDAADLTRALNAAVSRILPSAGAQVTAEADGVRVAGTIEVPRSLRFFGSFLNVDTVIVHTDSGLNFSRVEIGSVPVPAGLVRPFAAFLIDQVVGSGKGQLAIESVSSVQVKGSQILVTFRVPEGLYDDFKSAAANLVHRGNVDAIRAYYAAIVQLSRLKADEKQVEFVTYVSSLAELAAERSTLNDAAEENRAMILALAVFFGDSRFSLLLGQVSQGIEAPPGFNRFGVKLSGRHDWVQHFVTSAALEVSAGSDVANLIGEAKEILDAEGPSGFSFTDIAADRAGVWFAHAATQSNGAARRLQEQLSRNTSERAFFPEVRDLPEGLTEVQFKQRFKDVGAPEYDTLIGVIDTRIQQAAVHSD